VGVVCFLLAAFGCGLPGFRAALVGHCVVHVASGPVINEALYNKTKTVQPYDRTTRPRPYKTVQQNLSYAVQLFPSVVSPLGGACSVVMGNVTLRKGYSQFGNRMNSHVPGRDRQHPMPMATWGTNAQPIFAQYCI
jgi:hypothetical protein